MFEIKRVVVWMTGIRGINILSPAVQPISMVAFVTFQYKDFTINQDPLYSFGGHKL